MRYNNSNHNINNKSLLFNYSKKKKKWYSNYAEVVNRFLRTLLDITLYLNLSISALDALGCSFFK